ncbi:MAG TPA: hypothetical protein VK876_04440 [Rubrivivax sp.]|nr:hypothetical protein [Rubrivivax sp.]
MNRVRCHRQIFATFLVAVLLYAQLAAAAYSCPGLQVPPAAAVAESMVDCTSHPLGQMDPDQPQLCKAHCDPGEQSPNSGAGGLLSAGAAPLPVLLWVLPQADTPAGIEAPVCAPANGPPRGAPPLYLSLLVLRI